MRRIFTIISVAISAMSAFAQNPASTVLTTNFNDAFTETGGNPKGWVSANILASGTVTASNPGYATTSAARIETKTLVINPVPTVIPTTSGILLTGKLQQVGLSYTVIQGQPYTSKPEGMVYYSKYAPVGVDSAFAYLVLSKWNATTNKRDTIGIAGDTIKAAITTWQKRTMPIYYLNNTLSPDTILMVFSSSSRTAAQLGTVLTIDEIDLYPPGTSSIKESVKNSNLMLYPNPATSNLTIKNYDGNIASVNIIDVTGRTHKSIKLINEITTLSITDINSGLYFVCAYNTRGELISTKKLEVVK